MADKSISELVAATSIGSTDLFVLEQTGTAKKLTGQILENWLVSYADGHGGIQSIVKTSSTGTDPVIDTYTITYADTTTSEFTVTNGLKGDKGDQMYFWIKYASRYPQADSDMSNSPDDWIGVYSGTSSTAPTHYGDYTWFQWKGETGDPAILQTNAVAYQASNNGTTVPTGTWSATVPYVTPGNFLWTRIILTWNNGDPITYYTVSRYGVDGEGAAGTDVPLPDSATGEVGTSLYFAREDHVHPTFLYEVTVNISAASASSQIGSATDARINENTHLIRAEIANPSCQTSDWTVTTYNSAPQVRIVGTASAATTVKLILAEAI